MKRIIAFLCVFMYFASPYRLFGHALPEVIGLIAIILQLTQSTKIRLMNGYGCFMLYMMFVPPLVSYINGLPGDYSVSFLPIALIFYSIAFLVLLPNLDMGYVLKYYKYLVYLSVGLFFIQEISYQVIGLRPTFYLPLEMYYEDSDLAGFSESRALMERSSSFFLEPAHFAQYILPYFCIATYKVLKEKKLTWEFVIIGVALLLLQSGSGYIGVLAILLTVLLMKGLVPMSVKILFVSALGVGLVFVSSVLISNPFVIEIISRLNEVTTLEITAHGSQSGFLRIWRGYLIYGAMDPIYKLFGVGVGSLEYVASLLYIPESRFQGSFLNGIQGLLVTGGIIGTLLFTKFLIKLFKQICIEGKIILICMISVFFVEQMLFTPKMFLYILIAIAVTNNYHDLFRSYRTIRK